MNRLSVITVFLLLIFKGVFSAGILSAESPEVPAETKALYEEALVKVSLLRHYIDSLIMGRPLRNERTALTQSLEKLDRSLKSDDMIKIMSGYDGKVEGENAGKRMLRIYRREIRQPFVEKITAKRMKRPRDDVFPNGYTGFEDQWSDLMDQDKVHFNSLPGIDNFSELNGHITQKAVETVRKRVKDIYVEQGGVLNENGEINFMEWDVKSKTCIFSIDEFNFRQAYKELPLIKFTKK